MHMSLLSLEYGPYHSVLNCHEDKITILEPKRILNVRKYRVKRYFGNIIRLRCCDDKNI